MADCRRTRACSRAGLRGADTTGNVDAFSDIDFSAAVIEGAIAGVTQEAREALTALSRLDIDHQLVADPDRRHVIFHIDGAAPDLLLSLCGSGQHVREQ
jgi:hypothetical protein